MPDNLPDFVTADQGSDNQPALPDFVSSVPSLPDFVQSNAPQAQISAPDLSSNIPAQPPLSADVQPTALPANPDLIKPAPSIIGAVGRTALRDVAPTLAGVAAAPIGGTLGRFAGAAAGARGGALLGALVPGLGETGISEGIGAVIGGLVGGIGSFIATQKAAKVVEQGAADEISPSASNPFSSASESQDVAAQPLAAELTDLALMGKPNPFNLVRAARTITTDAGQAALKDLFTTGASADGYKTWQATTDAATQKAVMNVLNVAQNGGINAVFNAADQIRSGDYSVPQLLKSAAEGALFNEPWIHAKNPATDQFDTAVNNQTTGDQNEIQQRQAESSVSSPTSQVESQPAEQAAQPDINIATPELNGDGAHADEPPAADSQPENVPINLAPTTIIKGIVATPVDADTHIVSVNGKDAAVLKYVDADGLNAVQQSVGATGWDGYFVKNDPQTQQPTIYINRQYMDSANPIFTHETTHLLDAMGLVTPEQKAGVVEKYGKDVEPEVIQRYTQFNQENNLPVPTPQQIQDETFANILQGWHKNDNAPKITWIQRAINFVRGIVGLGKTGERHAQDILAGKFKEPAAEGSVTTAASVPPDDVTKPDPNWRVTVQPDEVENGKTLPTGYVQIDDVSGGVNKWSSSPEKLAQKGIQVPDFSKLPKGRYTYSEAVKALGEKDQASVPKKPQVFYRGTNPESDQRIKEVFTEAKGNTFMARKPESAAMYGSRIEKIESNPEAKILSENTPEFGKVSKIRGYDPEIGLLNQKSVKGSLVEIVNSAIKNAREAGYDAISFGDDSGIGTVILNESAFKRSAPQFSVANHDDMTPEEKLSASPKVAVKLPVGATHLRVTDSTGKSETIPLNKFNGENPVAGRDVKKATPVAIKTSGIYKGSTVPVKGAVDVKPQFSVAKKSRPKSGDPIPAERETINPSQDRQVGKNGAGEAVYERADGSRYRIRLDRPTTSPNGYPDFGGDLAVNPNGEPPPIIPNVSVNEAAHDGVKKRAQVGGIPEVGQERDTESISDNQAHIRERLFDGTKAVSNENTSSAWQVFDEMTGKSKAQIAGQLKDAFGGSRLLLGLYKGEVWKYARKLAIHGDDSLLRAMYDHSEQFETLAGGGASTAGSALRAEGENANDPINRALQTAYETERENAANSESGVNRETFTNLLKKLRDLNLTPDEVEKTVKERKLKNGKTIQQEIEAVPEKETPAEKSNKIDDDIANQIAKEKLEELRLKYEGAEWLKPEGGVNEVLRVITDALKGQSRDSEGKIVLGPDGKPLINPVLDASKPLAESTASKLTALGVDADTANALGYQIESARKTEFANRRVKVMQSAANSKNIRSLIESILETPYRAQSDPKWLHETSVRWFESNGLGKEQAEAAARLFENQFKEALANASNRVAKSVLDKKVTPKTYEDLQKLIRAGVFDPNKNWIDVLAQKNGWKKPTPEQLKKLQELEHKASSPELSPEEVADLKEQQLHVVMHFGKRDGITARAFGESFTASLLSGIRTLTVQLSPMIMNFRDLAVTSAFDPKFSMTYARSMYNAFKANAVSAFKYAWMKDAYGFHLNELQHGFNELKRISEEADEVIKSKTASIQSKGLAYVKKVYALQRYVFRNLNSLDQASMAVTREWKLAYYSAQAFKMAGLNPKNVAELIDSMEMMRRNEFEKAVQSGLDKNTAQVRANSRVESAVWDFVNNATGKSELADQVLKASENDIYSTVGRVPKGLTSLDEGFLTRFTGFNHFLQFVSKIRSESGLHNIAATSLVGMINIPFRTTRYFSDFSPYGLLRYGIYKYRQNRGLENYWKQTYGNALQARARLYSALAGTVAMGAFTAWAVHSSTSDDKAGDEDFGMYITGRGPDNKVLADAWAKRGFKQYSMNFVIGGRIVSIPLTRAGEALLYPFIVPAALDDYAWKVKEAAASGHPIKSPVSSATASLIGEALSMTGQSGILQTFGQLQQATQNGGSLAKAAVKVGVSAVSSTVLPFRQLLASVSDMFFGSMDQSSISALIANQFPIVGLPFQTPAVNRFGDPLYDRSWYGIIARTGVPIAFQVDRTPENERLYTTLVDKGASPPPLNRSDLESKYGELTDAQFKQFATISGQTLKASVQSNLAAIQGMSPEDAKKLLLKLANQANGVAVANLGLGGSGGQAASGNVASASGGTAQQQKKTRKSSPRAKRVTASFYNSRIKPVKTAKSSKTKRPKAGSLYGLQPRHLYGA